MLPGRTEPDCVRRSSPGGIGYAINEKPAFAKALAGGGGDGEIRTRDTVSRIHTFQACSFNRSDTSPGLGGLSGPSRRANLVEGRREGKLFFRLFMRLGGGCF